MREFVSIRIEAGDGGCIEINASGIAPLGAQVYLFADEDFKKIEEDPDSGERIALMEFTDMKTVMPNAPTWTMVVPRGGVWHVVYRPSQTHAVTVHHVNNTH